ncbi:hypothetical protein N9Q27_01130 [bacterium]|nr:hypothetical protein [bacterium]
MTNSQTQIDEFTISMDHFFAMQAELGMKTVWSIYETGPVKSDHAIFTNKMRKVVYTFVRTDATCEEIYNDLKNGTNTAMAQVSSFAVNGTVASLWAAAESCIKQSGTHHSYIEDFEMQDDGSLLLVTGS